MCVRIKILGRKLVVQFNFIIKGARERKNSNKNMLCQLHAGPFSDNIFFNKNLIKNCNVCTRFLTLNVICIWHKIMCYDVLQPLWSKRKRKITVEKNLLSHSFFHLSRNVYVLQWRRAAIVKNSVDISRVSQIDIIRS